MLLIDQKIFRRAKKGISNCPFNLFLFQSLQKESLSSQDVFENKSKYLSPEFMFINSSLFIENEFLKLIKIGMKELLVFLLVRLKKSITDLVV